MIKRFFSKTPSFFKNIRNISILVTALSGTAMFQKNKTLVEVAEIVGAVSTATALMSQLPKEHE